MYATQQTEKTRLGDILLDKGLINETQLNEAIASQQGTDLPLGQILVDKGWLSRRQIDQALKVQSKLRSAIVSSIISLSPLALVGCGSAATSDEEPVEIQQVEEPGGQEAQGNSEEASNDSSDNSSDAGDTGGSVVGGQDDSGSDDQQAGSGESQSGSSDSSGSDNEGSSDATDGQEQEASLGAIEFSWAYPSQRADGSDFEVYEIQGFRIYQVAGNGEVDTVHEVDGLDTSYIVTELADGDYHFAITVVDTDGLESDLSDSISVTI
ncbi:MULTISPECIES: hypothetical protein [unclassified Oleiphilus]|jgi:hypothetical protein|nr:MULTISPECIES: hypothetical protein [unclassified Oleiphilus]KZY40991.1 hypothetical protein A3732_18965 [Oleiphilus sp. HI0050]KZY76636.1 hypothetical protein A3740_01750 [Oleiphilus sp. HI0068]KZY86384.1 hypothetical protein A3741_14465 [Oleiphilus sp. HI0069]KZY87948.1 hypothetical protein A3743_13165 [Oleiphilus sp. HI0072]KZZ11034.1 hypothetical protein A3749_01215 [Oleiphilus sp. HI0078]KZZ20141.1 hypothetical protein A3752_12600 [Oleiphilus sp. HI0081]KZZ33966.1 hypothetical protein